MEKKDKYIVVIPQRKLVVTFRGITVFNVCIYYMYINTHLLQSWRTDFCVS